MGGSAGLQLQKVFPLPGPEEPLFSCLLPEEEAVKKLLIPEDTSGGDQAQVRTIPPY